jgi:hypothetical protein
MNPAPHGAGNSRVVNEEGTDPCERRNSTYLTDWRKDDDEWIQFDKVMCIR